MESSAPAARHWTITTIAAEQGGTIVLRVVPTREAVPCPACGALSDRRHSWYERRALDLPWRGATVRLLVHARRWFLLGILAGVGAELTRAGLGADAACSQIGRRAPTPPA